MTLGAVNDRVSGRPPAAARLRDRVWKRAQRSLPFAITAIVLAVLSRKYGVAEIGRQVRAGHAFALVPYAAALALTYLAWGALCDFLLVRRVASVPLWEVVRGKAAVAVLTSLGYAFGNGGYGVWIARVTGAGAATATGLIAYFMLSDLAAVGVVATAAMAVSPSPAPSALRLAALLVAAVPLALLALGSLATVRAGRGTALLRPWREVSLGVGFLQVVGRCVNIALASVLTAVATRAFGLAIPVWALATYLPILALIGALPINVAGLGAVQAAWVVFFLPWEPAAKIIAFQFLWSAAFALAIVLRGLPFLRRALAQIAAGGEPRQPAAAAPDPAVALPIVTRRPTSRLLRRLSGCAGAALVAATLSAGCGGSASSAGGNGSGTACSNPSNGECTTYPNLGAGDVGSQNRFCTQTMGTVVDACPAAGRLGCCTYALFGVDYVDCYYCSDTPTHTSPTASDDEASCASMTSNGRPIGVWTPGDVAICSAVSGESDAGK